MVIMVAILLSVTVGLIMGNSRAKFRRGVVVVVILPMVLLGILVKLYIIKCQGKVAIIMGNTDTSDLACQPDYGLATTQQDAICLAFGSRFCFPTDG
ncbi:hypothetical protein BGX38DRAFT_1180642 [Terfezia claveryi]|nr:hypothetical protein BGX38DRAFT_1180642 [Terfezia claveryi]